MVSAEPGLKDDGGAILQAGIGPPVRVVLLAQTQVVEALLPVDESVTSPEYVSVTPEPGAVAVTDRLLPWVGPRSEERRVGKECRTGRLPDEQKRLVE